MNEERPEEEGFDDAPLEYPEEDSREVTLEEFFGEEVWKEAKEAVDKIHALLDEEREQNLPWQRVTVMMRPAFLYLSLFLCGKMHHKTMTLFHLWEEGKMSRRWETSHRCSYLTDLLDRHFHDNFHELATGVHWLLYRDAGRIVKDEPKDEEHPDDPGCKNAIELLRKAMRYYLHPDLKGDFEKIKEAVEGHAIIGPQDPRDWQAIEGLVKLAYRPPLPPPPYVSLPPDDGSPAENGFDDHIPF